MSYNPLNPNGQASMAASQPVVIASDQSPVSVLATIFGRPSISGQVGASVVGTVPVTQVTSPWIVTGSVQGSFTPSGNQSVSGTVQVDVRGSVATVIIGGSIAASFTPPANQSVSGTVGASIIGLPPVNVTNTNLNVSGSVAAWLQSSNASVITVGSPVANQSVSGTVNVGNFPTNQNVSGSVIAFPTGNQSVSGTVQTDVRGSVAMVIIGGSIAASFTPPANQSVSGTVNIGTGGPVSVLGTMSVLGTVPVTQATTPWVVNSTGSVLTVQTGTTVTSLVSTVPSSVIVGASIFGQLPAGTATIGSVATLQGTNPWIIYWPAPSIVGTFAEDLGHTNTDKGVFVLGIRNETMTSVTSADNDYSQISTGPSGEVITANAPLTKWVQGTASMLGGGPVTGSLVPIIGAQGTSVFTYITGIQIANAAATSAWITLFGGTNSVIGYTIAPGNGGSNIYYPNGLKTNANNSFSASISAVSSVYISAQGFASKS